MAYQPLNNRGTQNTPQKKQWWKLLVWAGFIAILYWMYSSYSYSSDIESSVSETKSFSIFSIESGTASSLIADKLEEQGFIVSGSSFLKYITDSEIDTNIYAGKHSLSPHMTIPEIAQVITTQVENVTITLREGLTIAEIDKTLSNKGIFEAGEFLECVQTTCSFSQYSFLPLSRTEYEGYLFPATYSIPASELSPQFLANKMLSAFQGRIEKHSLKADSDRTLQDLVIMASLIEKESSSHSGEESAMIAGILWNRIDQGIPLGVDASTRYALQKDSSALTRTDLAHDGLFNTRLNKGLPPHAISSPGDASLLAARNPSQTDYLFYLHDKSGTIHYATTNAGHEQNKTTFCGASCE